MKTKLHIKKASRPEIEELLQIYIEKVEWLKKSNIPLWDETQFTVESLNTKYISPEFFVGIINNSIIGGFILIERDDDYWPNNSSDKALYFHKFVIKNGHGSLGYSKEILDWVKKYCKQQNKEYLRLDFDDTREYVKNMYLSNGFIPIDRVYDKKGKPLIRAEIKL